MNLDDIPYDANTYLPYISATIKRKEPSVKSKGPDRGLTKSQINWGRFDPQELVMNPPPLQTQTQLPKPRNLPNLSQSQGGARTGSQAYDAKHMEGGGGRSGEVADWSRPGSSWRRIDKKLGGRTEEPRGVATCQNCPQRAATAPLGRVAKVWSTYLAREVQKHISDSHYGYRPFTPPNQSFGKIESCAKCYIYIDSKAERKLEKIVVAEETKTKNHAKHLYVCGKR